MDARSILLSQHALIHSDAVCPAKGKPINDAIWSRVTEAQMREVLDGHCSLTWLLWHMTRSEDAGINALVRGVPQVLERDGWADRIGIDELNVGTAMSDDDVRNLSQRLDLAAFRSYRDAVGRETRAWLESVDLDALDADLNAEVQLGPRKVFPERILPVLEGVFESMTGQWVVNRLGIWHNFYHLGEAFHVMQMLGVQTRG
jgi:hypothetical protein